MLVGTDEADGSERPDQHLVTQGGRALCVGYDLHETALEGSGSLPDRAALLQALARSASPSAAWASRLPSAVAAANSPPQAT